MKPSKFLETVEILENKQFETISKRLQDPETVRLFHSFIGLTTEVGELQDLFKKKVLYGKEIEKDKIVDELGDVMWYLGVACNALGVSLEEVMEKNWKKLSTRYGDKLQFTEQAALNKNKEAEWKAMNDGEVKRGET